MCVDDWELRRQLKGELGVEAIAVDVEEGYRSRPSIFGESLKN